MAIYDSTKVTQFGTERVSYTEGIGKNVSSAKSVSEVMKLSGLDFLTNKFKTEFFFDKKIILPDGTTKVETQRHPMPKTYAIVRTDNLKVLGCVGEQYQILQNSESFDFLDSLNATGEAVFDTAGSYDDGAKSFITMKTDQIKILDDQIDPLILFVNSFDGTGAVKAMLTPVRVTCKNTMALAIRKASNKISIRHTNSMAHRLEAAKEILLAQTKYLCELKAISEKLALKPFTKEAFQAFLQEKFPEKGDLSDVQKARNKVMIEDILKAYEAPDVANYKDTAYGAVLAATDFESHKPQFKQTSGIELKNIKTVMKGMPLSNEVFLRMMA